MVHRFELYITLTVVMQCMKFGSYVVTASLGSLKEIRMNIFQTDSKPQCLIVKGLNVSYIRTNTFQKKNHCISINIHAGGEKTGGCPTDCFEIYNPQTNVWKAGSRLPSPRVWISCTLLSEKSLFAAGGTFKGKGRNNFWYVKWFYVLISYSHREFFVNFILYFSRKNSSKFTLAYLTDLNLQIS